MPKRKLITESDVHEAAKRGARALSVEEGAIVTPSARDAASKLNVHLLPEPLPSAKTAFDSVSIFHPANKQAIHRETIIALGADHGGFSMKEQLKAYLLELGYSLADVGTNSDQACDYPDFAYAVASLVSSGKAEKGIMIDAVGVASAIVANKVPGIRAVAAATEFVARSSREHNDANVLTLGGRVLGVEVAKSITKLWLETWFGGGRHQARVKKISDIEERALRRPREL
jgi:ribose 5-phosphate isomerase B